MLGYVPNVGGAWLAGAPDPRLRAAARRPRRPRACAGRRGLRAGGGGGGLQRHHRHGPQRPRRGAARADGVPGTQHRWHLHGLERARPRRGPRARRRHPGRHRATGPRASGHGTRTAAARHHPDGRRVWRGAGGPAPVGGGPSRYRLSGFGRDGRPNRLRRAAVERVVREDGGRPPRTIDLPADAWSPTRRSWPRRSADGRPTRSSATTTSSRWRSSTGCGDVGSRCRAMSRSPASTTSPSPGWPTRA